MALSDKKMYTLDAIYHLPEGTRAELIDGQIFYMAPPSRRHQQVSMSLSYQIKDYLISHHGTCEVYTAPFAVFLNEDQVYVEPDISVICDPNHLNDKGCIGAPDWIIEIVSPSSRKMDYYTKLSLYKNFGVRLYWIVDIDKQTVLVYDLEHEKIPAIYTFADKIPVSIYEKCFIDFSVV